MRFEISGLSVQLILFICLPFCVQGIQNCIGSPSQISVSQGSTPSSVKVTWSTTGVTCTLIGFDIKYDSLSPLRISRSKNVTSNERSTELTLHPSFKYQINVYGILKTGEEEGPPNYIPYTVPNAAPGTPSGIHTVSKNHTSIKICWDQLQIFLKNGIMQGYNAGYKRQSSPGKFEVLSGESNTCYTINGLNPGESVTFVVQAVNDFGKGNFSSPIVFLSEPIATTVPPVTAAKPTTTTTTKAPTTTSTTKPTTPTTTSSTTSTTARPSSTTTATTHKITSPTTHGATTQQTITFSKGNSKVTTTSLISTDKDEADRTSNLPMILGIVGVSLLLLAILIPLMFFLCRYCCKTVVGPSDKRPIKDEFRNFDSDSHTSDEEFNNETSGNKTNIVHQSKSSSGVTDHLQISPLMAVINIRPGPLEQITTVIHGSTASVSRTPPIKRMPRDHDAFVNKTQENVPVEQPTPKSQWEPRYKSNNMQNFNSVKNNHYSHTNNVFIDFLKLGSIFPKQKTVKKSTIASHRKGSYTNDFMEMMDPHPVFSSRNDGLTSYHSTPRLTSKTVTPRVEIEEDRH